VTELYGPTIFALAPKHFVGFAPPGTAQSGTLQDISNPETTVVETPNKNLSPEHDRTWTGGIVYTPKWMSKLIPNSTLTLTVDLWDVERKGVVVFLCPQEVISGYNAGTVPGVVSPAIPPSGQRLYSTRKAISMGSKALLQTADVRMRAGLILAFSSK
jgi:hypothetical protein